MKGRPLRGGDLHVRRVRRGLHVASMKGRPLRGGDFSSNLNTQYAVQPR